MLIIKNARIHTAVSETVICGDIKIENGKIAQIAPGINADGCEVFDACGRDVFPGFIDAHTHIGMFGIGGSASKDDVESTDRCVPHHRGIDCINTDEPTFRDALEAGVTCVCVGPGSVSCVAGTALAIKTHGNMIQDMIVKDPVGMKIAFGENPKTMSGITTRMTVAATIRDLLQRAKEYSLQKDAAALGKGAMPKTDMKLEAMIPVIKKEIPLKAHAHQKQDILTAVRIAREFDVDLTLEHASDCGSIIEYLASMGYPIVVGPHFGQARKPENINKSPADSVKLIEAGCCVSVMTDAPVIAEQYLPLCAGLLMREGLDEFRALQTITINPAKHLGIADRVGSIEVGKDADLVIARGCPIQVSVKPDAVFAEGKLVYKR